MFLLLLFFTQCYTFNLDTQTVHVVKSTNGLFGFSVALHQTSTENLLLVGSPHAQTSQPGVQKGGAIIKCGIPNISDSSDVPVACDSQIESFSDGGNPYYNTIGDINVEETAEFNILAANKSLQFLGASLQSTNKFVVACAHRYELRFWFRSEIDDLPRQLVGRYL